MPRASTTNQHYKDRADLHNPLLAHVERCACIIHDGALYSGLPRPIRLSTRSWWRTTSFRRDFHAKWGVQALCRSVHGGASVYQDRSGRHRPGVVLRYEGGRLFPGRQAQLSVGKRNSQHHRPDSQLALPPLLRKMLWEAAERVPGSAPSSPS